MLGAYIVMLETTSFLFGIVDNLLVFVRIGGDLKKKGVSALARTALHFFAQLVEIDTQILEYLDGHRVLLSQESEQDVLRTDHIMTEPFGFLLGVFVYDSFGSFGKIKHGETPTGEGTSVQ